MEHHATPRLSQKQVLSTKQEQALQLFRDATVLRTQRFNEGNHTEEEKRSFRGLMMAALYQVSFDVHHSTQDAGSSRERS